MVVLADDSQMFTCSSDGTLALWQIQDSEGRLSKRERVVPYSEEVLITKIELDVSDVTAAYNFCAMIKTVC